MPKRKRNEPSLEENLAKWKKELVRGLKLAKGFERQRLSKRIREADAGKAARLEREVAVLKSLDLQQAAHAYLCSSLLKIKGVAESPKLPADIKPIPKPELPEDAKAALHNVTSALCNRKQVKDIIDEAVMGTCIALRVPMPEKRTKAKSKELSAIGTRSKTETSETPQDSESDDDAIAAAGSEDEEESEFEGFDDGPPLLKRKVEDDGGGEDLESDASSASSQNQDFAFSDSDAEERAFSKYDDLVGGSSDEDDDDDDDDQENGSDKADSRAKMVRKFDDISLSSEQSSELEDSEDDALAPPTKKTRTKAALPASYRPGDSAFLPSLMGGYVSGSDSEASDIDVAPPTRKNRRGQRARQAIWEKKYGDKAKHHERQKDSRNDGWDMKRGAVDDGGGSSTPWKNGIKNPFEKNQVHPDRQRQMQKSDRDDRRETRQHRGKGRGQGGPVEAAPPVKKSKPRLPPSRDDLGALHPSWAAAKLAKDGGQKIEFQGKKVTFD